MKGPGRVRTYQNPDHTLKPHRAMGRSEQLDAVTLSPGMRYPITKLECPLVERLSVASVLRRR